MDGTLDGTDKAHVDSTNGLSVDVKALPAHVDIRHLNATDDTIAVSAGTATIGAVKIAENGKTRKSIRQIISSSLSGTGNGIVWTPATGSRFVLTKIVVSAKTAGDIEFYDGTDSGNTVIGPILTLAAGGGWSESWPMDMPYRSAAVNNVLKYNSGTVITGSVYVEGWEETS